MLVQRSSRRTSRAVTFGDEGKGAIVTSRCRDW
uniref:Uncharacterized protein n=1 Tax=Arundo donax TaxID=35708 RepID=A0A0A8ZBD1_ARUDO